MTEIRLEIEVPGTPEQVWDAIATGPGISAWFVPTRMDEREGGRVHQSFGTLGDEEAVVTAWEPPRRVAFESAAGGPLAFEWLVEARGEGSCVVRLVNSGFREGSEWEGQVESMREGWWLFLRILRSYLSRFPGERCRSVQPVGNTPGGRADGWARYAGALGVAEATVGDRVRLSVPGAPPVEGEVEWADPSALGLVLDAPAPGLAFVTVEGDGETVTPSAYLYFYGEGADAAASACGPAWTTWMDEHFPMPAPTQTG